MLDWMVANKEAVTAVVIAIINAIWALLSRKTAKKNGEKAVKHQTNAGVAMDFLKSIMNTWSDDDKKEAKGQLHDAQKLQGVNEEAEDTLRAINADSGGKIDITAGGVLEDGKIKPRVGLNFGWKFPGRG